MRAKRWREEEGHNPAIDPEPRRRIVKLPSSGHYYQDVNHPGSDFVLISMRLLVVLGLVAFCSCPAYSQSAKPLTAARQVQNPRTDTTNLAAKPASSPVQLEMRVPFEPTAFPSGSHLYLAYEIHLTNYFPVPLSLRRIEVLDRAAKDGPPVAAFEGDQLEKMLQLLSGPGSDPKGRLIIGGGQSAIVYMWIEFDRGSRIPNSLVHRVTANLGEVEGAMIARETASCAYWGRRWEGQIGLRTTARATTRTIITGGE